MVVPKFLGQLKNVNSILQFVLPCYPLWGKWNECAVLSD